MSRMADPAEDGPLLPFSYAVERDGSTTLYCFNQFGAQVWLKVPYGTSQQDILDAYERELTASKPLVETPVSPTHAFDVLKEILG